MVKKLSLFVVLMLLMTGLAQAQEIPPVPCGALAEADCEILRQSQQAMMQVTAAEIALAANFSLENVPDVPFPLTFSLAGTGAYSGDLASLTQSPEAMQAMMSDPAAYSAFFGELLTALDAQLSVVLTLPEELVAQAGADVSNAIPLELRLIDGVGYIHFDPLTEALGAQAQGQLPPGWGGLDLAGLVSQAMAQQMETMGDMGAMTGGMNAEMMQQFSNPEFINQYLQISRLDDATADDGANVAVFQSTIDFAGLMNDPAIQELMQQSMQQSLETQGAELSEEEMAQVNQMVTAMFDGMDFTSTQQIGLDDFYVRSVVTSLDWDMASFMESMNEISGSESTEDVPPFFLHFDAAISYSNHNGAVTITAPENASMLPLEALGMGEAATSSGG